MLTCLETLLRKNQTNQAGGKNGFFIKSPITNSDYSATP